MTVRGRASQAKLTSATGCELTIQHIKSRRQKDATTSHARDPFDGRVFRRDSGCAAVGCRFADKRCGERAADPVQQWRTNAVLGQSRQ